MKLNKPEGQTSQQRKPTEPYSSLLQAYKRNRLIGMDSEKDGPSFLSAVLLQAYPQSEKQSRKRELLETVLKPT